jgi:hypothetical protein
VLAGLQTSPRVDLLARGCISVHHDPYLHRFGRACMAKDGGRRYPYRMLETIKRAALRGVRAAGHRLLRLGHPSLTVRAPQGPLVGIRARTGEVASPRRRFWRFPLSAIEGNFEVLCSLGAFRILTPSRLPKRYPGQAVSPKRSSRTGRSPPSWSSAFGRGKLVSHNRKQYSASARSMLHAAPG